MVSTHENGSASDASTLESVKNYYGQVLKTKNDLKTTACCTSDVYPPHILEILRDVHPEVIERSYGCGIPVPFHIEGCTVVDMGCGAGRDAFILSKLVGEKGQVIGVDMTPEQLEVANRHLQFHTEQFGYKQPNIKFVQGYMEDLQSAGVEDSSVDLVISNCVFNLSPSKETLFSEVLRVLKPGGELYFSDVFTDRRLPEGSMEDDVLLGECLGGALYVEDFRRMMNRLGVMDFRVIAESPIDITDPDVLQKTGQANFSSVTIRLFKLDLEDQCEDYGQAAVYNGTIPGLAHAFELDDHHLFETGRIVSVCRNTAKMIADTRFGQHFTIYGNEDTHYGLFPCGPETPHSGNQKSSCC